MHVPLKHEHSFTFICKNVQFKSVWTTNALVRKQTKKHPEYYNFADKKNALLETQKPNQNYQAHLCISFQLLYPKSQTESLRNWLAAIRWTDKLYYKNTVENVTPVKCHLHLGRSAFTHRKPDIPLIPPKVQHSSTTVPAEEEYSFFFTSRKPGLSLSTCLKVGAKQVPIKRKSRRLGQAVPSCLNTSVSSNVGTTLASYTMRSSRLQPLSSSRWT